MAKQINCSICLSSGDTVAMVLKEFYFKCPECQAEVHLNDNGDDTFIRNWQQQQQHISRSFQPGTHVMGGTEPTGKCKKAAMGKKSISRLNFEACEPRYY